MSTEAAAAKLGAGRYAQAIEDACIRFGIDTTLRKAHFLAQVAHESGGFRYVREIWGPTAAQRGYEGRADLGNVRPGDGKRFMGRGLIQITGRANYTEYSADMYGDDRCVQEPVMLEMLPDAALCAGWFWQKRGLNRLADIDDIRAVTKRINGGYNGLADRQLWLAKAKQAFREMTHA